MNDRPNYILDTIAAIATAPGKGGIGIVRISGDQAEAIAKQMLGKLPPPRIATRATFLAQDVVSIDSGVAIYFPAPNSFTGESVLELQGHGGPVVLSMLMNAAISFGARRAEPGEFSKRAYLNGKLDLVQAEAVADLIDSGTAQAARAAHRSLTGEFSSAIDALSEKLVRARIHVEAAIDFPEEEIDFLSDTSLLALLDECGQAFDRLQKGASAGRLLRDGFQVVLLGRTNAGKSSLLNVLSGTEAAIVTEVAGTTRDIIREQIDIDGLAVELVDTAGLRENPGTIEAEGIRRAHDALAKADAVLCIEDAQASGEKRAQEKIPDGVPVIVLRNKIDLTGEAAGAVGADTINVSAKTGAGIDALREAIASLAGYHDLGEGAFTARQRHIQALDAAAGHFARGRSALTAHRAGELLAEELRLSQTALGLITGDVSSDELLGRIFSEFCIGK